MNSVPFARVVRSSSVGSTQPWKRADPRAGSVRRELGFLIGLTLLVSGCRGCSYHARSEWHSGSGSSSSSGGEVEEHPEQRERTTRRTGRRSSAGRDNVVRVTGDGNKSQGDQGGAGKAPDRTVVRPSGDVPPSSGDSGHSAQGENGRGGRGESSGASGAAPEPAGTPSEAAAPARPGEPAEPAAQTPAEPVPDDGKPSLKSPSEPHVTTPTQRKPRKVHRDGATNKEGRRE